MRFAVVSDPACYAYPDEGRNVSIRFEVRGGFRLSRSAT